jgi:NADH:ubiquinone oxidoreductase subunit E
VMMVNGAYQENLSAEKVDAMLKDMT